MLLLIETFYKGANIVHLDGHTELKALDYNRGVYCFWLFCWPNRFLLFFDKPDLLMVVLLFLLILSILLFPTIPIPHSGIAFPRPLLLF